MINPTERDERNYLEETKERISFMLGRIARRVNDFSEELRQTKQYLHEHQSGLDEADQVAALQSIDRMASSGEESVARRNKLMKQAASPYFGRIDFQIRNDDEIKPIYVGLATFSDDQNYPIYDWRAPIASMFYDFELGEGYFNSPTGEIKGNITLKRQYKIRGGAMEFMIESSVSIHDEVLQRELSKSSDDKMRNIAATIQRDQNMVIRNESASVMIIQGVAGSGKTSIALHRIAFMLYRFRDSIKSKDILILSPNKVFADYISNVLPELGEEQIPETNMEELANDLLEKRFTFQTFFQQVALLLDRPQQEFIERVKFKSSFDFVKQLNRYFIHLENSPQTHVELKVAGVTVPIPYIVERYKLRSRMPMNKRVPEVVQEVLQFIRTGSNRKFTGGDIDRVKDVVRRVFNIRTPLEAYRGFYDWIKRPEMFHPGQNGRLEYSDVYPLIYCKIRLEGVQSHDHIKHLLVDEMQDYTPVQYAVLSRIFKCRKTILGDINQSVNPYSASSLEGIEEVFPQGEVVKLFRSYRSTWEITQLGLQLKPNVDLIALERYGEKPQVLGFDSHEQEIEAIRDMIRRFEESGGQSLAIICKTQQQVNNIYQKIKAPNVHLLSPDSTTFSDGVLVVNAHLAKGLEFDEVIIPFASADNYQTAIDKHMLYIACTRAMHRLAITFVNEQSEFLK